MLKAKNTIEAVTIDSFIQNDNSPKVHPEGRGYKFSYVVNKVIITNDGNSSIYDCEGFLGKDDNKVQISWNTKERDKTTINPHADKELEVCALINFNLSEFNGRNDTTLNLEQCRDLLTELRVPPLMSPTEASFGGSPSLNRPMQPGKYHLFVSGKDELPLETKITIHSEFLDIDGVFITFD